MKFLLDTVVLSEARKPRRDTHVARWLALVARNELFVSVASIVEIQRGIILAQRRNREFAQALEQWLGTIIARYAGQIVPVGLGVARRWGALSAAIGHRELDLAIAATALEHDMVVVTRNTSDFLPAGVPVLNPFAPHPAVIQPRSPH